MAPKLVELLTKTIVGIIILCIIAAVPIAIICVGLYYYNSCPLDTNIPLFMVVFGGANMLLIYIALVLFICREDECTTMKSFGVFLILLLGLFNFVWNIIGSVWVFSERNTWNRDNTTCPKGAYLFAFSILIIYWITVPCQLMVGIWRARHKKKARNEEAMERPPRASGTLL